MIAYPTRRGRRGALRDHETHDRIRKWREYQTIASLQHFVLVALSERRIEVYSRDRDGWQLAVVEPPDDAVFLKAIGASLSNSATPAGGQVGSTPAAETPEPAAPRIGLTHKR